MGHPLIDEDGGDPVCREPSEDEVVRGPGSCRVRLRGLEVGLSYASSSSSVD